MRVSLPALREAHAACFASAGPPGRGRGRGAPLGLERVFGDRGREIPLEESSPEEWAQRTSRAMAAKKDLDQWIAKLKDCKHLTEDEVKTLCDRVRRAGCGGAAQGVRTDAR